VPTTSAIGVMSGTLVILRHGQSEWNLANLFTGWHDVPLTEKGCTSPRRDAPRRFRPASPWPPVERDRRLNERHHGALQGLDKKATTELHGAEQVHAWRRGYDTPPPAVELDSPEHPANDPRDAHLPPEVLPASECLKDVVNRVLPYWYDRIAPQLLDGLNVLVTAHGNSLRALLKHLEGVGDDEIADVNIPTGAPGSTRSTTVSGSRRPSISVTPRRSRRRLLPSPRKPARPRSPAGRRRLRIAGHSTTTPCAAPARTGRTLH